MNGIAPFEIAFRKSVRHHRMAPIGVISNSIISFNDYDEAILAMLELVFFLFSFGFVYNGIRVSNLVKINGKIYVTNFREINLMSIEKRIPIDQMDVEARICEYPISYEKCLVWTIGKYIQEFADRSIYIKARYSSIINLCLTNRYDRISMRKLSKILKLSYHRENDFVVVNTYGIIRDYEDHHYFAQLWLVEKIPSEIILLSIKLYWNYNSLLERVNKSTYNVVILIMYAADMLNYRKLIKLDRLIYIFNLNKSKLLQYYKWLYVTYLTHLSIHMMQVVMKSELLTIDTIAYLISTDKTLIKNKLLIRKHFGIAYFNQPIPNQIHIPLNLRYLITNSTIDNYIMS